jgi:hypothetical protein
MRANREERTQYSCRSYKFGGARSDLRTSWTWRKYRHPTDRGAPSMRTRASSTNGAPTAQIISSTHANASSRRCSPSRTARSTAGR